MKKFSIMLCLLIGIIIVTIFLNPLRSSEERIRHSLLEIIPFGTNMDETINIIKDNKWEIIWISEKGYRIDEKWKSGERIHIRANIGHYRNFFVTDVVADFWFDEAKTLVNISIKKYTDGF